MATLEKTYTVNEIGELVGLPHERVMTILETNHVPVTPAPGGGRRVTHTALTPALADLWAAAKPQAITPERPYSAARRAVAAEKR